jgi:anti-sigma B factor antagonist
MDTPRPVPAPVIEGANLERSAECEDQSPLWIEVEDRSDGISALIIEGEVDLSNAHRVYDAVLIVAETSQLTTVELDVAAVTFIDSSGLSALIKAATTLRDRNGELTLRNPSAPVARLLTVTGLTDHLRSSRSQ